VDDVLKEELGPLHVGIPGFYEAFFGEIAGLKAVAEAGFCASVSPPRNHLENMWRLIVLYIHERPKTPL
jgi:hypothetical protein